MIDFEPTVEQQELVEGVRRFSKQRLAPAYAKREEDEAFDRPTISEMGSLGYFGVDLPEEYGGLGLDSVTAGLVTEAMCADDMNLGYLSVNISLVGRILAEYGRPEVVSPWLTGMIGGTTIPSIAVTEPGAGSDAGQIALTARRDGDEYVLTGEKTSISMVTQADFSVVFGRTGSVDSGAHGISAFLVPMDLPNIATTTFKDHGNRSIGRGSLFLDGVRVPRTYLLGEENRGFTQVMQGFDYRGFLTRPALVGEEERGRQQRSSRSSTDID